MVRRDSYTSMKRWKFTRMVHRFMNAGPFICIINKICEKKFYIYMEPVFIQPYSEKFTLVKYRIQTFINVFQTAVTFWMYVVFKKYTGCDCMDPVILITNYANLITRCYGKCNSTSCRHQKQFVQVNF